MVFQRIPPGRFTMGGTEAPDALAQAFPTLEPRRFTELADENPAHTVHIRRAFYLGRHEVTVGQFRRFLEASGYQPESEADGTGGYGYNPAYDPATTQRGDAFEGRDPRYSWRNPGFAQGDDHPVVNVTWNDAQALARWLSRTEGHHYRLPTEAEWEYAARAGAEGWPFPTGINDTGPGESCSGRYGTCAVRSYRPEAFGLHDLAGNVREWTSGYYVDYALHARANPRGALVS